MTLHARPTRKYRPLIIPMRFIAALAGLSLATSAQATPASTAEPQQKRVLLAMMDEMGMGGGMSGMSDAQPGGAQMGGAGGNSGTTGRTDSMCCMGAMGKPLGTGTAMGIPSALPGFPGASHLHHVGASGFFLDYAGKLGLSVEQTTALNIVKLRSLVEQSAAQRKVDEAEQGILDAHCGRSARCRRGRSQSSRNREDKVRCATRLCPRGRRSGQDPERGPAEDGPWHGSDAERRSCEGHDEIGRLHSLQWNLWLLAPGTKNR